jgi:hypothetical protein
MGSSRILEELNRITEDVQRDFTLERRVLSFHQYLELFANDPLSYCRDAARYMRDMFDHFGREDVSRPTGKDARFKLFSM